MATGILGTNARQDPRQVVNTLKCVFGYADAGIATGKPFPNPLPQNAFIENILAEVVQVFNAGTTNPISVGTVGPAYNDLITTVTNTAGTVTTPNAGALGRSKTALGDVMPYVKYTPTGTAPTTGQGIVVIFYEGGWLT